MEEISVHEVTDFQKQVVDRSHDIPVLVDFWAEWCGPCRVLGPTLERLAAKADGRWVLAKVDTDAHQDVAATYGIRSIPAVKLFVDGEVTNEFVGALPEASVREWLRKALPDPLRKLVAHAEQLIADGSIARATTELEDILRGSPDNERARTLLAGLLWTSDHRKAVGLVHGIEEHSENFPLADAVRTVASLLDKLDAPESLEDDPVRQQYLRAARSLSEGDYRAALEGFIGVIRSNRYYDDDGARKACVALFRLLGDEHPVTRQFRREFSSALY